MHRRIIGVATAGVCVAGLAAPPAPADMVQILSCFGQPATIVEHREDVTVVGTSRRDVIVAPGNASVHARGGDDLICVAGDARGGEGDDRISVRGHPSGEPMLSFAEGGPGDDEIHREEPFVDDVHLSATFGGPGNDVLRGGANPDTMRGGPGIDHLHGRAQFDLLNGGPGPDVLLGGFFEIICSEGPDLTGSSGERVTTRLLVDAVTIESWGSSTSTPLSVGTAPTCARRK